MLRHALLRLTALLLLLLHLAPSQAQALQGVIGPSQDPFEGKTVLSIDVTGERRYSEDRLRAALGVSVGEPYSAAKVEEGIEYLWALFQVRAEVAQRLVEGGVDLRLQVTELPADLEPRFIGNSGVKLEKMLFGMWAPHKVKLAVSGCPRNCAEAGIKDVGVIGVDSGYELYIAGNGGIKTEVAMFMCKVKNDSDVLEYSGAFLQLYREEAYYLERTCHYVARVGIDTVKNIIVENEARRKELYERLLYSLQGYEDPWANVVATQSKEYKALEVA